jgi:hypothetical protein
MKIVIWSSTVQFNGNNFEEMDRLPEVDDPILKSLRIIQIKSQFIL